MAKSFVAFKEGQLTTGGVALTLGVLPRRLRGWIRAGLLPPPDLCRNAGHWGFSGAWVVKARPVARRLKRG